jgi:hypothetical protein
MTTYPNRGATRSCAATGRTLQPGEPYFGVIVDEAGKFVRKDFAANAWSGPPSGAVGFWTGRVPKVDDTRRPPVNDEVLAECLARLANDPDPGRANFRYVVALLLMRRKRLKFEDTTRRDGRDVMILWDAKTGVRHEVADPRLTEAEMADVQNEVFRLLGWE